MKYSGSCQEALEHFGLKEERCCDACHQDADGPGSGMLDFVTETKYWNVCCAVHTQIEKYLATPDIV